MKNKTIGYLHQKYWNAKNYSETLNIPKINELLQIYTEKAKGVEQPEWYSKYVALYFTFDEETYVIYPCDIKTSNEIFELLENPFADDLYVIGAYDIFCSGMID